MTKAVLLSENQMMFILLSSAAVVLHFFESWIYVSICGYEQTMDQKWCQYCLSGDVFRIK